MTRLWDISPAVATDSALFPGDEAYTLRWTARIGPGCPVNLSAITMSPHIGAHADAPLHYADGERSIAEVALEPYLGPCRVIDAIGPARLIRPDDIAPFAQALPPRVLVRTCESAPRHWSPTFSSFAPQTIDWLADRGVQLVGIDSQSVDPADSKTLPSHHRLLARDLRVLENLVLDEIAAGDYELIALPLKLTQACASPVRAVLREIDHR